MWEYIAVASGGIVSIAFKNLYKKKNEYLRIPDMCLSPLMLYVTLTHNPVAYFLDIVGAGYYMQRFIGLVETLTQKYEKLKVKRKHNKTKYITRSVEKTYPKLKIDNNTLIKEEDGIFILATVSEYPDDDTIEKLINDNCS